MYCTFPREGVAMYKLESDDLYLLMKRAVRKHDTS